jgi:hypothetical protein
MVVCPGSRESVSRVPIVNAESPTIVTPSRSSVAFPTFVMAIESIADSPSSTWTEGKVNATGDAAIAGAAPAFGGFSEPSSKWYSTQPSHKRGITGHSVAPRR